VAVVTGMAKLQKIGFHSQISKGQKRDSAGLTKEAVSTVYWAGHLMGMGLARWICQSTGHMSLTCSQTHVSL